MDGRSMLATLPTLLLQALVLAHTALSCAPEFLVQPESVSVKTGDSTSFSCVLDLPVTEWFINETIPVTHHLPDNSYVFWDGCSHGACGATLLIKSIDESLNGSSISCQVWHESCNGSNISLSHPAVIMVRGHVSSTGKSPQPSPLLLPASSSSAALLSLAVSPSPDLSPPKTPDSLDKSAKTDETMTKVTERLVQRVPLMAGAAGVCFVVGCVFGTLCAVTICRGTSRHRRHKNKRVRSRDDVVISPPLQRRFDPNYAELSTVRTNTSVSSSTATNTSSESSAASNSSPLNSGSVCEGRRENDYTELGMPDTPQFPSSRLATSRTGVSNRLGQRDSAAGVGDPCSDCSLAPPLPPRGGQEQASECQTCIDVDLDELERVVLQQ